MWELGRGVVRVNLFVRREGRLKGLNVVETYHCYDMSCEGVEWERKKKSV
jgi:hypothetical protein